MVKEPKRDTTLNISEKVNQISPQSSNFTKSLNSENSKLLNHNGSILSLKRIRGLTTKQAEILIKMGFRSIIQISNTEVFEIYNSCGFNFNECKRIVQAAKAYLSPNGIWTEDFSFTDSNNCILIDLIKSHELDKIFLIGIGFQDKINQFYATTNNFHIQTKFKKSDPQTKTSKYEDELFLLIQVYNLLLRIIDEHGTNITLVCHSIDNFEIEQLLQAAEKYNFKDLQNLLTNMVNKGLTKDFGIELSKCFEPPSGSLDLFNLARTFKIETKFNATNKTKLDLLYSGKILKKEPFPQKMLELALLYNKDRIRILDKLILKLSNNENGN